MSVFSYQLTTWGKFIFWMALRKCQQHWKQLATSNWLILAELNKENAYKHKEKVKGKCKWVLVSRAPLPPVGLKGRGLGGEGLLSGSAASRKRGELDYRTLQAGIPENNYPEMILLSPSDLLVFPLTKPNGKTRNKVACCWAQTV